MYGEHKRLKKNENEGAEGNYEQGQECHELVLKISPSLFFRGKKIRSVRGLRTWSPTVLLAALEPF